MAERKQEAEDSVKERKVGHGIVRDDKGQIQPADKQRAQQVNRKNRGGDPPGEKGTRE